MMRGGPAEMLAVSCLMLSRLNHRSTILVTRLRLRSLRQNGYSIARRSFGAAASLSKERRFLFWYRQRSFFAPLQFALRT